MARLGHYSLTEKIGEGGMGVVYRARDEHLDCDVALKVLPAGMLADPAARKRFRKEALTLSKLNHPNIATIHDFDSETGVDFLVMEFIAGETLSDRVRAGALPEKTVLSIGMQMADGLAAAHEQGIIHRDLKPANLKVRTDGRLKILDFGLARIARSSDTEATVSATESRAGFAGTLPYMAPEQLRNEPVDGRTDIWAAGVVLYELATGTLPFADHGVRLTDAILHAAPPSPLALQPRLSPRLATVISKCLEKDPASRYQSVKELLVDLRRVAAPTALSPARRGKTRRAIVIATVAVLVTAAALVVAWKRCAWSGTCAGGNARIRALAVLPFRSVSAEQDYFAEGLTEELITCLTNVGSLRVKSPSSVRRYKDRAKTLKEIAHELSVDAVVDATILRSGDRVRINAALVEAATDSNVWAQVFERDVREVSSLSLQNEIARDITQNIQLKLTPQEEARLHGNRKLNTEAYDAYLKGRYYVSRFTKESTARGLSYLNDAIALDPSFADGIAAYYFAVDEFFLSPAEVVPRAKDAVQKSLTLDPSRAEPHQMLGMISYWHEWDWAGAEKEFRRAIDLSPKSAQAHAYLGWTFATQRRFEPAYAEMKQAQELDSQSSEISSFVGWLLYFMRREDDAAQQLRNTIARDPSFWIPHWYYGHVLVRQGRLREAIAEFQEVRHLTEDGAGVEGSIAEAIGALARARALNGDRGEAVRLLAELDRLRRTGRYMPAYPEVGAYAALGQKDRALQKLEQAYQDRSMYVTWLAIDPALDSLRSEPGFEELLERLGLPQ